MRLLDTSTLELVDLENQDRDIPYAILSHTWGNDEVLFDDVRHLGPGELATHVRKAGTDKVLKSCDKARENGFQYIWIDTCCIDKSSSAELSEAINSMFKWYGDAAICYAYLADVDKTNEAVEFEESRWFKRGWTLQELIAPCAVEFFDKTWQPLGDRPTLAHRITKITTIDPTLLGQHTVFDLSMILGRISVATRMSWATNRETKRGEDMAYCLMGIFDINMPLLYGEGTEKAFVRLQHEIIQHWNDQSILAWTVDEWSYWDSVKALAPSPRVRFLGDISSFPRAKQCQTISIYGGKVRLDVVLGELNGFGDPESARYLAVLDCHASNSFHTRPALLLERAADVGDATYIKVDSIVIWVDADSCGNVTMRVVGPGYSDIRMDGDGFKDASIYLLERRGKYQPNPSHPPLRVSLSSDPPGAPAYLLRGSTSDIKEGYIAPQPFLSWVWFVPNLRSRVIRAGVLYFRPTQLEPAKPTPGFFVVWGVKLPQELDWYHDLHHSWWDDGAPRVCILPFVPSARLGWESWDAEKIINMFFSLESCFRSIDDLLRPGDDGPPDFTADKQQMTMDGVVVTASMRAIRFLGRTSFELEVTTTETIFSAALTDQTVAKK